MRVPVIQNENVLYNYIMQQMFYSITNVITCYPMQEHFIQCKNMLNNVKIMLSNVKRCDPMQGMCYATQQT